MNKRRREIKSPVKGVPSAVLLSVGIHALLFLLAGMLIVFTVVQKEQVDFNPPRIIQRPKMKLQKPRVPVKKSRPNNRTTKILSKTKRVDMPRLSLPEVGHVGGGLEHGDVGGFDMMPELSQVTLFGGGVSIGNDFVGAFYDFKRRPDGSPQPMSDNDFVDRLIQFTRDGWKESNLRDVYRAEKKLYATTLIMPLTRSYLAPKAFHVDTGGYTWMVHYKGPLVHQDPITFRFWGHGDDIMVARVDGKVVLNASWPDEGRGNSMLGGTWQSSDVKSRQYYLGNNRAVIGDWITLEAGVPQEMEVIIGETPGGGFCSYLLVEVEGETYELNKQGGPILPIFKTAELSPELIDEISEHLVPGEASLTNGPVFRDYTISSEKATSPSEEALEGVERDQEEEVRTWTSKDGRTLEATYLNGVSGQIVLQTRNERQVTILYSELSEEDRRYVDLRIPPRLKVEFSKKSSQKHQEDLSPYLDEDPARIFEYVFTAKVKQADLREYRHPLTVEYFAVAQRMVDSNQYRLMDYNRASFDLSKENGHAFELSGLPVEFVQYDMAGSSRGFRFAESLVVVSDSRGEIIAVESTAKWLHENLDRLKQLKVGSYMDKSCLRVVPTGPPSDKY